MKYEHMNIDELRQELDNNKINGEELFNIAHEKSLKYQDDINIYVTIMDKYKSYCKSKSILTDIPYALKDNFSTKGILTTASSNILKDYIPIYDSTVYKKLKDSGAILVGKTVLDELAMGGTGTTGHTGIVRNPWNKTRMIGGSSSGSCAAVALGIVPFAIGSDTGDSIRKPASYGGVVGYKPTYGLISRYGLFAFASSLDHVGCFARSVKDIAYVTDIVKGYDKNDMTSLQDNDKVYSKTLDNSIKGKKLFYIKEACDINEYKEKDEMLINVLNSFHNNLNKLCKIGFQIEEVSINRDLLNALYPTYCTISCAEATSNNSNLTGIQFGSRGHGESIENIVFDARTKGFSELIKRRFVIGSYVLQKENQEKLFLNACRVRRMVVDKMNNLFKEYDGLIMPAAGSIAPKFEDKSDKLTDKYLILENHLVIGNFGGFPSITLPSGMIEDMPIGINLTGRIFEDDVLLNMANKIEKELGYEGMIVGDKNV